jgi:hypothetical protein
VTPSPPNTEVALVLSKLAYLTLCRSIQLFVLLTRGDAAKDLEILVLATSSPCCAARPHVQGSSPPTGRCSLRPAGSASSLLVLLLREAGDAAALAPTADCRRLDLFTSQTRPTSTR